MPRWNIFGSKKEKNQDDSQAASPEQLFSTAGDYGLKTLAEGSEDGVDIVFVHGLTGNRESTWTYEGFTLWPRDLLAKEEGFERARILTFGYDADIVGVLKTAGSNNIRGHGKSLAQDLSMRRLKTNSSERPLIFVAHSLGGLVVEQAILIARGSSQPHVKALLPSTVAIAFMGTPHLGSSKADWAHPLTQLSNLVKNTNKEIVSVLQPGSEMLANLQQEFHSLLEDRRRNEGKWMDIFCFYEEVKYPGIGYIVPPQSAILSAYPNASIPQHHSNMTKFSGETDVGYMRVRDQLWQWIDTVNKNASHAKLTPGQPQAEPENKDSFEDREQRSTKGRVSTGGGAYFAGNISAGRDFNYNQNPTLP